MTAQTNVIDQSDFVASICRESFEEFVREFWECVPGSGKLIWNWHLSLICHELQVATERVLAGQKKLYDLVFNVPFGTSKSTVISIMYPDWYWTRNPAGRFITASHTDSLVHDLADKSQSVVESEKYQKCFPNVHIRRDRSARDDFMTTDGGGRMSCTVGGKTPTGRHAHVVLVDDPIDPQGARSEAELENAAKFMSEVIPSRVVDKEVSLMVLIMQRLHFRDPTAQIEEIAKRDGATPIRKICLPGELDENISPSLEEIRERWPEAYGEDDLLDPIRLPRTILKMYRATLGEYGYACQVMQKPMPPGGGMFKREYFERRVKAAPYHAKRIRFWDRAATLDGCFSAGVLMAYHEGNFYVEHVEKGQWEPDERNRKMRATAMRDRARYGPKNEPAIDVEREGGSSGRDAWLGVARALVGFNVREVTVTGSKDARAEPWACQCAAGTVHLVEDGTWDIEAYIQEHCLFRPEVGKRLGKWKDQVDASSGGCNRLIGARSPGTVRVLGGHKSYNKKIVRFVVCSRNELANVVFDNKAVLVSVQDPAPKGDGVLPGHGIDKLMDSLVVQFADLDSAEVQGSVERDEAKWDDPIPPYDKPVTELVVTTEIAKKIWAFVLKKREPAWEICILQDEGDGDRRALSIAFALCDAMRLPRNQSVCLLADSDYQGEGEAAPNQHVFDVMCSSRVMVIA